MEQPVNTNISSQMPVVRRKQTMPLDPVIGEHIRGGEPKRIGELMEPIRKIIDHPDRNRLIADFFKRFW